MSAGIRVSAGVASSRKLDGMPAQPELAPVALAEEKRQQGIQASSPETEREHCRRPQDGNRQRPLAVQDPTGKQQEASVQVHQGDDTPRHFHQLAAFSEEITHRKTVDQYSRHDQQA